MKSCQGRLPMTQWARCLYYLFPMLLLSCGILTTPVMAATPMEKTVVSVNGLWTGQTQGTTPSDPIVKLMHANPSIQVKEWAGITLQGGAGRTPLMMAFAGQTAPDLYLSWFHIIRKDVEQGFTYPLNQWIGDDKNGDGVIDANEAKWPGWAKIPAISRQVATVNGKIYGLPVATTNYMGIVYRIDLIRQAGLNPDRPPKTWDEFAYWCQKLTDPARKTRGFALPAYGFCWLPWMNTVGGSPVVQIKTSPTTKKSYTFPMEATKFITPDGEDLTKVESKWQADLDSPAAIAATEFYHRLRWQPWIKDPVTKEPINLTEDQRAAGRVPLPDGRVVRFSNNDVIEGMIKTVGGSSDNTDWQSEMSKGTIAMTQWFFNDLSGYQQSLGINPDLLGVFAIPAGPGGKPVVQMQRHFATMSEGVRRRTPAEQDKVWQVLTTLTSQENIDDHIREMVLSGKARFVNPHDLDRLGYGQYKHEVPRSLQMLYSDIDSGKALVRTEPFMGFWVSVDSDINTKVLSLMLSTSGKNFDYRRALHEVNSQANTGEMFKRSRAQIQRYRPIGWTIFSIVSVIMLFFVCMIVKTNLMAQSKSKISASAGVYNTWLPWIMLLPALGLVALWGYYPLMRGVVMAMQDYHIVGKSPWVGVDNFINIFLNPKFYVYCAKTLKFVVLSMTFAFTAPILLSLLLSEIPRWKIFWRSVFFLPQLTSGLVVTLLWKQMYDSTENGLLNQIVALFGHKPVDWLGDPSIAMLATIIPGIWAGTGMASLIYLAALKGIPDELYEAAALDGAGIWAKLRLITVPQLMPLIIINFIGAFIGTFQGMGSIFLLTFGGPGDETNVLSLAIWKAAYNDLQFSTATAMAWILGSALIGFTYLQIRVLRKVEFRRVEEV